MTTEAKKERKRTINRLQSIYPIRALIDKQYQDALEAQKEGRPVAWSMSELFSSPFFSAMGLDVVYPENYGTVCANQGVAQGYLNCSEAAGFPNYLCGYMQNALGYSARMMKDLGGEIPPEAPEGGMPKPLFLLSAGCYCDTRVMALQALGRYFDVPVFMMEHPHLEEFRSQGKESLREGAYERQLKFIVKEVREFVSFLERLLGKKMDWDKLEEEVDDTMKLDAVWWKIMQLRKARPCPMHLRDFYPTSSPSYFWTKNPKVATELYQKMLDEVQYRVDNKIAGINTEEKYRLVFEYIPPWHSMGIFDQLAERGWNFLQEALPLPTRPVDVSMYSDPIERLVRYRYESLAHEIDSEYEPEEAAKIKEELKRTGYSGKALLRRQVGYHFDGAFFHSSRSCRLGFGALFKKEQYLEVAKIPSLVVQGDIIDLTLFDPVECMRNAVAFEETMDYYKEERRKIGGLLW